MYTIAELYLAFRQAKSALYYERRGVGLLELASYEENLAANLLVLQEKLAEHSWFDSVAPGEVWVIPKRLHPIKSEENAVVHIGGGMERSGPRILDVQLRLSPSSEFAIVELLYLRSFGPALDSLLAKEAVGYRLDIKNGRLAAHRRWVFDYWPARYREFRSEPLAKAQELLRASAEPVVIVSADLASFYDTVDPSFLLQEPFLSSLRDSPAGAMIDMEEYRQATESLLSAYARFREEGAKRLGTGVEIGVPIGALTSRVVANLALQTLDSHILAQEGVVSYRRYVDDLVIVAHGKAGVSQDELLGRFLPIVENDSDAVILDVGVLNRTGSEFSLQKTKTRIHCLVGIPGLDFVEAVAADFERLVSERRAFLDTSILMQDGVRHMVRASDDSGSPLRVLRDADRAHLERYSLSTSLSSLERVSSLADLDEARRTVRSTLERVNRVLDLDDNWASSLEVTLRVLKLAIATKDWESCAEINSHLDATWGSTSALKKTGLKLRHCGHPIKKNLERPWIWLRNYLHHRRLEAVCSALSTSLSDGDIQTWLPAGLLVRNRYLGARALRSRARDLAASDLRSRDREDDAASCLSTEPDSDWVVPDLDASPGLRHRLETIASFTERCSELGHQPWSIPAGRLFLCTRPPSYFDIARRWLCRTEVQGFSKSIFQELLELVNAIRGTDYSDAVGTTEDRHTVVLPWSHQFGEQVGPALQADPRIILGNLVVSNSQFEGSATRVVGAEHGAPQLGLRRLLGLNRVLGLASKAAGSKGRDGKVPPTVLVLPELSLPRHWFRVVASHVVRVGRFGLVAGLEYVHDKVNPYVWNQAYAVFPGPFSSVATWPWTKRQPARGEAAELAKLPTPVSFPPTHTSPKPRTVIKSPWGNFSVLICSELIETRRVADLLGRVELVLCPAWNRDTSSFEHLVQSAGFQLHAIVAIANNGSYSDCRAWAPLETRWRRDLCRLIERGVNDIVHVDLPLQSLRAFHDSNGSPGAKEFVWKPLPPEWP